LLSSFKSEAGSAESEFVLLVVPASLLVKPLLDLFGLFQVAIVKEQVSYDIARYAALADVSPAEANGYREEHDPQGSLATDDNGVDCVWLHASVISRRVTLWPETVVVPIEARAECEK